MPRVSLTIDERLNKTIRKVQGAIISATGEEWSFTTVVNMFLFAGIIAQKYLDPKLEIEFWKYVVSFVARHDKTELYINDDQILKNILKAFQKEKG